LLVVSLAWLVISLFQLVIALFRLGHLAVSAGLIISLQFK
jgi:hypothetical protein